MHNKNALPKTEVFKIINRMRVYYGRKFSDQWSCVQADELIEAMSIGFAGLSNAEIMHGMQQMAVEPLPPTIPEFRRWCRPVYQLNLIFPSALCVCNCGRSRT